MSGRDWSPEIDILVGYLTEYYLFPDVAERVGLLLRRRLATAAPSRTKRSKRSRP